MVGSYKMLVHIYQTSWCRIPEGSNIHNHHSDNLKSHCTCTKDYRKFWRGGINSEDTYACIRLFNRPSVGLVRRQDWMLQQHRCHQRGRTRSNRNSIWIHDIWTPASPIWERSLRTISADGLDWLNVLCTYRSYVLLQNFCLKIWLDLHTEVWDSDGSDY
jgi:hypothetical protein